MNAIVQARMQVWRGQHLPRVGRRPSLRGHPLSSRPSRPEPRRRARAQTVAARVRLAHTSMSGDPGVDLHELSPVAIGVLCPVHRKVPDRAKILRECARHPGDQKCATTPSSLPPLSPNSLTSTSCSVARLRKGHPWGE